MKADEVSQLVDSFGTDIYRFCMKLCRIRVDAEDLYQQTFLRVLEIETAIVWEDNPKAFLFSIANSLWKNTIRKSARHSRIAPTSGIEEENEFLFLSDKDTEGDVLTKIQNDKLHEIITELPDKFQIPIQLCYSFELSVEEISKIMKIPQGTVKSRLFKGRNLIKRRLEESGYGRF